MAEAQPGPATDSPTRAQEDVQASNPSSARPRARGVRFRAAKACRRCNEKRVKCDASERGTPCTRCIQRQEPDCRMIQSRRGIYVRKPRRQMPTAPASLLEQASTDAQQPRPGGSEHLPSTSPEGGDASSHEGISWATMFSQLIDGHRQDGHVPNKCSITYLGESFPLSIILKDLKGDNAGQPLLHHNELPSPSSHPHRQPVGTHPPPGIRPEELAYAEAMGAFKAPSRDVLEALVAVFLDIVFPIYPIVNRQEFLQQHKSRKTPWILLHAVCSVSATLCPPQVLYRAGFESRQQARQLFYSRAKALFDVGHESDKVVLLQVTILLSFWGGGPNDTWNFYSWIGMGVTIAETIGCHRSMAGTNLRPQDRSLLKRLWWVLVVRDASSAALIGRPFKVNLEHCDVDALSIADFEHDVDLRQGPEGRTASCAVLYQIHAAKLAIILRRIILARFQPQPDLSVTCASLREMLASWRSQLAPELNWSDNVGEYLNIFASTLSTMYNHNLILTYLASRASQQRQDDHSEAPRSQRITEEAMSQAAQQIAQVACSAVTRYDIFSAPHELFHGVFLAAAVFYMQTKNTNQMAAQLGMSGLTNCKMVFQASRDSWDPSPWFTQLFDRGLFALNPRIFTRTDLSSGTGTPLHGAALGSEGPDAGTGGLFPANYDLCQNHPVLGNILDMALNTSTLMDMGSEFDDRSGTPWFGL